MYNCPGTNCFLESNSFFRQVFDTDRKGHAPQRLSPVATAHTERPRPKKSNTNNNNNNNNNHQHEPKTRKPKPSTAAHKATACIMPMATTSQRQRQSIMPFCIYFRLKQGYYVCQTYFLYNCTGSSADDDMYVYVVCML